MSNFTRSVLYSTTVMVAGLIGIFALYNNVTALNDGGGGAFADISPAANKSDMGINAEEVMNHLKAETPDISLEVTAPMVDKAVSIAHDMDSKLIETEDKIEGKLKIESAVSPITGAMPQQ